MKIRVFKSHSEYGFTKDKTGDNLPADKGPWVHFKVIESEPEERGRIAVDSVEMHQHIAKDTYYLVKKKGLITFGIEE